MTTIDREKVKDLKEEIKSQNEYWFTWDSVPGSETKSMLTHLDATLNIDLKSPEIKIIKVGDRTLDISSDKHHFSFTLTDTILKDETGTLDVNIDDNTEKSKLLEFKIFATKEEGTIKVFGPNIPPGPVPPPHDTYY
jgi:hypothetical protein